MKEKRKSKLAEANIESKNSLETGIEIIIKIAK